MMIDWTGQRLKVEDLRSFARYRLKSKDTRTGQLVIKQLEGQFGRVDFQEALKGSKDTEIALALKRAGDFVLDIYQELGAIC